MCQVEPTTVRNTGKQNKRGVHQELMNKTKNTSDSQVFTVKCFHEAEFLTRVSPIADNAELHIEGMETEAWEAE